MESPILLTESEHKANSIYQELYEESKILNVKCFKWLHDHKRNKYDEMFDYETEKFILSEYNVKNSFTIVDNFERISYQDGVQDGNLDCCDTDSFIDEKDSKSGLSIFNREFTKKNIIVEKIDKNFVLKYNSSAYQVCKYYSETDPGLELSIGRFIRVGKFILKVSVLKINNIIKFKNSTGKESTNACSELNSNSKDGCDNNIQFTSNRDESQTTCKFCFKGETKLEDPLISVCNCSGTMKYLHILCLQTWIKNKCKVDYEYLNPNCFKITLEKFFCEICKKTFPLMVTKGNRNIFILNILKTRNNFIILKSKLIDDEFSFSNFRNDTKQFKEKKLEFCFIQFDILSYKKNPCVVFGRDKKCDIVLNDVSVSRKHFMIYIDTDKESARIKDLNSKFGTLINMQGDILLKDKETIQKGNTVYHFKTSTIICPVPIDSNYAIENLALSRSSH